MSLNPCSNGIWSLTKRNRISDLRFFSLNPCSNGIWSLTQEPAAPCITGTGLNPCSNGIWSLTRFFIFFVLLNFVLILVLMEYGL